MTPASRTALGPMLRAEAQIDLDAIRSSVAVLRARAGAASLMAVVKADGYGHGAVPAARAALDAGATWLGVAYLEEAQQLRGAGLEAPILLLAEPAPDVVADAVALGVDVAVGTAASLDAAATCGSGARVHLKVDTGLSRGGSRAEGWPALCAAAAAAQSTGGLTVIGVWSHLACADEPTHPSIERQVADFRDALEVASSYGLHPELRHLASSGGILARPDTHFDLVRAGISLYGISPGPAVGSAAELGLRPAMRLRARVALTKRVPAGTGVSYGHRHVTTHETTLALVPLGYADGVPRAAAGVAEVLLGGRRRVIAGTVCMDQFLVEVDDDRVAAGDEVVIFGPGDDGEPTADEWARSMATIGYEVVTRIGARVPRVYVGEGSLVPFGEGSLVPFGEGSP
ncbi:MAG TPA: alanine racemase [Mycobacteriales bacterium]|nr:alanine racemase [Mycobacteriales bacterium]